MKQWLSIMLVILALIGMADAGYITYEKEVLKVIPLCGQGFDCGKVLDSQWAKIGPVPISILGFGLYFVLFILAACIVLEIDPVTRITHNKLSTAQLHLAFSSSGLLTTIGLVCLMAFVIKAWCLFCLVSGATISLLWLGSLLLYRAKVV